MSRWFRALCLGVPRPIAHTRLLVGLVLVMVALAACASGATTPEEAARHDLERVSGGAVLASWTIHLTQPWQDGILVVASFGRQPGKLNLSMSAAPSCNGPGAAGKHGGATVSVAPQFHDGSCTAVTTLQAHPSCTAGCSQRK